MGRHEFCALEGKMGFDELVKRKDGKEHVALTNIGSLVGVQHMDVDPKLASCAIKKCIDMTSLTTVMCVCPKDTPCDLRTN